MSALRFRNLDVSPEEPVEDWPFEGVVTAIERGALPIGSDWRRRSTPSRGARSLVM